MKEHVVVRSADKVPGSTGVCGIGLSTKGIQAILLLAALAGAVHAEKIPYAKTDIVPPTPQWVATVRENAPATPTVAAPKRKVLVFSDRTGYEHKVIPHVNRVFEILGEKSGAFETTVTTDIEMLTPRGLDAYDVLVLQNNSSAVKETRQTRNLFLDELEDNAKYDSLTEFERQAKADSLEQSMLDFVAGGKGLVAIHGVTMLPNSAEFDGMIGGTFDYHPPNQEVAVRPVDEDHPLVAAFRGKGPLIHRDEPYCFKGAYSELDFRPLLSMDIEGLKDPQGHVGDIVRYVSWIKPHGNGRVFYCSPSHFPESYQSVTLLRFLLDGIQYAAGDLKCDDSTLASREQATIVRGRGQVEEATIAWWEAETVLEEDGSLDLSGKSWWEKAVALEIGGSLRITSELPGGGKMIVRRQEVVRRGGRKADTLVWIIDDDGDLGNANTDGDTDSDCYVVDYGRDGKVDRIVDYLDNDGDGTADEMDIRYFIDGVMRRSWFGLDLDNDGRMWDLMGYEYSGDFFKSDPYGNAMIFMNEYDPLRKVWVPSCECPFAFFDTDGDGQSEVVVRVSGVPLEFDPTKPQDMDYGNSVFSYSGPFTERMRHPGAVNFRYSFDIDGLSSNERPLHYEMGYNLIGHVPYEFKGMSQKNQLRRAPKVTNCIRHEDLRHVADTYPAEAVGFTWREYGDDAVSLGGPPAAGEDRRWEGVFWTWSRRFMHNTGGPIQNWNMRREFQPSPSNKRELYWCRADRRIHLKGATDGWIRVGHLANSDPWGEIRFFDTDRDGYFDRWETHLTGATMPVRVSTARDAGIRDLPSDYDELRRVYTKELLPEALEANHTLIGAMRKLGDYRVPEHLGTALSAATCDTERLYVNSLIREGLYLDLRRRLAKQSEELFAGFPPSDLRRKPEELATSIKAWNFSRLMSDLDAAYGEGRYDDAAKCLEKLAKE